MLLTIFYILLNSGSFPSILFMDSIFLAPLYTTSHLVLQGSRHMLSFFVVVVSWDSMVIIVGYSVSPSLVLGFVASLIFVINRFFGVYLVLECLKLLR